MRIEQVAAEATHALRRAELRDGRDDVTVHNAQDDLDDSFHLAAVAAGEIVGVVSCGPREHAEAPGGWQLYQMAVAAHRQGEGIGRKLVEELFSRVSAPTIWAHSRAEAVGFYERLGFTAGEAVYPGWAERPHRTVIRKLT